MTRLHDAFSRVSDYFSSKRENVAERLKVKRRKYVWKQNYYRSKDYVVSNLKTYSSVYGKYILFEFAPVVAAYGLMINFPLSVLLGWALTVETVVSWGLVFYFVSEEVVDVANELKPYIRISAKVDN